MPNKEPDPNARLDERLDGWKKDHLQGGTHIVIKHGKPSAGDPVSLVEFGSTRLDFQHAANYLEAMLLGHLRMSLEASKEVLQPEMPPQVACDLYQAHANQTWKEYLDRFKDGIADVQSAMRTRWDEYEHPFSLDDIDELEKRFESLAAGIRDASILAFKTAAPWSSTSPLQLAEVAETAAAHVKKAATVTSTLPSEPQTPTLPPESSVARKGDPSLLGEMNAVNFTIAEAYLGIKERQRQKLMKSGALTVQGGGANKKITTQSLKTYLPPEKPRTEPH